MAKFPRKLQKFTAKSRSSLVGSTYAAKPLANNNEITEMCYALNYVHLYERRKNGWQFYPIARRK